MDHFNTSAGSDSAPSAPAAPDNPYFTSGNPGLGVPATVPGPYWFHMVTEEIRNVILQASLVPDHENVMQLSEAIQVMILNSLAPEASETVKGIIEIATDAEAQLFTALKAIDGAKLNTAFKGSNQSLAASGYQKLPGGLILQWGADVAGASPITETYPIAFPNAVLYVGIMATDTSVNNYAALHGLPTLTNFTYKKASGASTTQFWFAIGY